MFFRDFVPDLFNNRSAIGYIPVRQVRGCGSIQYRAARLLLNLRYSSPNLFGGLTCSRRISFACLTCSLLINLRLAYILCCFIRNRRYSFDLLSGFTRGEYHVIRVDFIVALRRTKGRGRRTLRSPPSPSSGLHLIHPGDPLRRGISAAAVDRNIGSLFPVQVDNRQFRIWFGCFVFGLVSFAFQ